MYGQIKLGRINGLISAPLAPLFRTERNESLRSNVRCLQPCAAVASAYAVNCRCAAVVADIVATCRFTNGSRII